MKKCKKCGAVIIGEFDRCFDCGGKLSTCRGLKAKRPKATSGYCQKCASFEPSRYSEFRENISYIFRRQEKEYCGYLCFRCMTITYSEHTIKTLLFTWFGGIGIVLGPIYILGNTYTFLKNALGFVWGR
jgi:hypothetical protein